MNDALGEQFALLAPSVDVLTARSQMRRRLVAVRRRRVAMRSCLAAGCVVVAIAGLYGLTNRHVPAGRVGSADAPSPVGYAVIGTSDQNLDMLGELAVAGDDARLADLWSEDRMPGAAPIVDFSTQIVLTMTIADSPCPSALVAMDQTSPDTITAIFAEPTAATDAAASCAGPVVGRTYFVRADRSVVGESFTLQLPDRVGYYRDEHLDVIVTPNGVGLRDPQASLDQLSEYRDAAEHIIRAVDGSSSTAVCDLPLSTAAGTQFACTATKPDGSSSQLVAEVDGPDHVTVHDPAADGSAAPPSG